MSGRGEGDLQVLGTLWIPSAELEVEAVRSGGPGGQNVNKVASQIQLRWNVRTSGALDEAQRALLLQRLAHRLTVRGELLVRASRFRHQARNLDDARERLSRLLQGALRVPKARRATRPTRASKERRLTAKRHRSETKRGRHRPPGET
jgi:ribosome-associated protein